MRQFVIYGVFIFKMHLLRYILLHLVNFRCIRKVYSRPFVINFSSLYLRDTKTNF